MGPRPVTGYPGFSNTGRGPCYAESYAEGFEQVDKCEP